MPKRGQAAMEFLMTYGWAILAVLISIAALAYFGVLNPARFLPQSCTLFPGVACTDSNANNVGVTLTVYNGLGQNLNPFIISIPGCPGSAQADNGLADGEKETIALTCNPGFVTNSKLKKDIDVTYTATSISHTRRGSISTAVENGYTANGEFEYLTGSNPFYWQFNSGETTTGSIDSTTSHSGSNSFKVISNGCGDCATFNHYLAFTLSATTSTYIITFWAKATNSAAKIRPVFRDANDNPLGGVCSPSISMVASYAEWTQYSNTCTTDKGLKALYFGFDGPYNDMITYWIDDVEVKKV